MYTSASAIGSTSSVSIAPMPPWPKSVCTLLGRCPRCGRRWRRTPNWCRQSSRRCRLFSSLLLRLRRAMHTHRSPSSASSAGRTAAERRRGSPAARRRSWARAEAGPRAWVWAWALPRRARERVLAPGPPLRRARPASALRRPWALRRACGLLGFRRLDRLGGFRGLGRFDRLGGFDGFRRLRGFGAGSGAFAAGAGGATGATGGFAACDCFWMSASCWFFISSSFCRSETFFSSAATRSLRFLGGLLASRRDRRAVMPALPAPSAGFERRSWSLGAAAGAGVPSSTFAVTRPLARWPPSAGRSADAATAWPTRAGIR